jgi:putative ABC transport system substrate-binding protein
MRRGECRVSGVREKAMKKAFVGLTLCAMLFALCSAVEAEQPKQVPRIGFLTTSPSIFPDRIEAFRQGLRELGYIEGKSIVIEWRYSEEKTDHFPALAAELVRLKVDVIVTGGPAIAVVLPTINIPAYGI